jgi:hypothetical protein
VLTCFLVVVGIFGRHGTDHELAPAHQVTVQHQAIDAIEPAQHLLVEHEHAALRERTRQLGSEHLTPEPSRPRQTAEQGRRRALEAAGGEEAQREPAE